MPLNGVVDERRVLARITLRSTPCVIIRKDESRCSGVTKSTGRWGHVELRVEVTDQPLDFALLAVRLEPKSQVDGKSRRDRPAVDRKQMGGGRAQTPLKGCGGDQLQEQHGDRGAGTTEAS